MAVAFDAVGAGSTNVNGFITALTTNHSHTASGSDRAVLGFAAAQASGGGLGGRSATYDGVAMTELIALEDSGSDDIAVIWGMLNPPTGAKTASCTIGDGGNQGRQQAFQTVSYTGVSAFGTTASSSGTGTTASVLNMVASTDAMVANCFTARQGLSAYTKTQRHLVTVPGNNTRLVVGDSVGSADVDFAVTVGVSDQWVGVAAILLPVVLASSGFFFF